MSTASSPSPSSVTNLSIGLLPTPSFGHLINVKLIRDNYLLWKVQFMPYLQSQQLLRYVDGSYSCPAKIIEESTASGTIQTPNPAYQVWLQQDQLVLSALLSSLSEDVLS